MRDVRAELEALLREFFGQPDLVLRREMVARDVPGWDSLAHLDLVATLEERFGVRFRLAEIPTLRNAGDLVDLLHRKLGS